MEYDQHKRQPKWKTTKIKDDQNGRRPKWKTTKMEDDQNFRQPNWKCFPAPLKLDISCY